MLTLEGGSPEPPQYASRMSITETRTVASIIAGQAREGGQRIESRNPANLDELVCEAWLGDAATFVDACRAAREAQRDWAATPAPVRGQAIERDRAPGRGEQGGARAPRDARDRQAVSRVARRGAGGHRHLRLLRLGEGRRLYGQTVPSEMPDKQLFTFRNPVGVAAIITAGNFPVAVPSWYLVPALLCGNAVVWKPAEYTPAIGEALAAAVPQRRPARRRAEPRAVRRPGHVRGARARARARALVDKVGFTGSSAVGSRIGELCGRHVQSPCLELGGKNPLVVMPDADLDLAVEGALFSGFGTAGQRCTSLGTVIVARVGPRRVHAPLHAGRRGRRDRRPVRGRALRADDPRALPGALRGLARADPRPPHGLRLDRHRADHRATTRARASSATPTPASSATRRSSTA